MKHEKLWIILCITSLLFLLFSCDTIFIPPYGRVMVKYTMEYDDNSTSIDSGNIKTSTLFLKQEGEVKKEVALPVIKEHTEGNYLLTSIHIGEYDISIELGDAADRILYTSETTIIVNRGDNGEEQMPDFMDFLAILDIVSEDYQDIEGITHADGSLQQGDTTIPIEFDFDNQTETTINATIPDIYPGDYDIEILVYKGEEVAFTGTKQLTLPRGIHSIYLKELNLKTGWVEITMNSDGDKPEIIEPGIDFDCEVNRTGPSNAIVRCKTNINATANILFSTIHGFNNENIPTLVVANSEQTDDTITHNATIQNFQDNQIYYYVILAIDEQGDTQVSSEYNFLISMPPSQACVDEIIGGRPALLDFYLSNDWDISPSNWINIIYDWATKLDRGGYYNEMEKYPIECDCTGN